MWVWADVKGADFRQLSLGEGIKISEFWSRIVYNVLINLPMYQKL